MPTVGENIPKPWSIRVNIRGGSTNPTKITGKPADTPGKLT